MCTHCNERRHWLTLITWQTSFPWHPCYATPLTLRPLFSHVFITNRFYLGKSNRITVPTIFCLSQCVHVYYTGGCLRENKSLFAWRTNPDLSIVGVARCRRHVKRWIFSLKMISEITAELQVPLSTLLSSVILHQYVELLRKNRTLKRMLQALKSLLKFKCPILAT